MRTNIEQISWQEAAELVRNPSKAWHVLRIDAKLDVEHYWNLTKQIMEEYALIKKDFYKTYEAIGLQQANGDDPLYESVLMTSSPSGKQYNQFRPGDFKDLNELGKRYQEYFDLLYEKLPDLGLFRTRILVAQPLHLHAAHVDERGCRLHFPLQTHKYAMMWFEDQPYHMRADGSLYICNTGVVSHNFGNLSSKLGNRTHIVTGVGVV